MKAKAPMYNGQINPFKEQIDELWKVVHELKGQCPDELYRALEAGMTNLSADCTANVQINRGSHISVGFGVSHMKKAIACDNIIAIVKQIKSVKGW